MNSRFNEARGARRLAGCTAALLLAFAANAFAQEGGCVQLTATAATEVEYVNSQGRKVTRLVPPAKVVPGDEVVWTITAKNICARPVDSVVIANPVPTHTRYVAGSAVGRTTTITYSLDGEKFLPAGALVVREADGKTRPARPDEYRFVRWAYQGALAPGALAEVRYRAIVD